MMMTTHFHVGRPAMLRAKSAGISDDVHTSG